MFLLVGKFYKKQILKFMVKSDTNYEKGSKYNDLVTNLAVINANLTKANNDIKQLQIELANEKAKTTTGTGGQSDKIKEMFENLINTPGAGIIPAWEKFQYTMTGFTYEQ